MTIFPVFYLPPIEYFSKFLHSEKVIFEVHEHFEKQTYRNRCSIYGANGKLNLIIPIKHQGERTPFKEVKISNENHWQTIHWRSLETAYRTSSFFEYYEHILAPFYEKKFTYLIDFNFALMHEIFKIIEFQPLRFSIEKTTGIQPLPVNITESFLKSYSEAEDLRNIFKTNSHNLNLTKNFEYPQVFSNKHGFITNLSIVDLIFNIGPEAGSFCRTMKLTR